MSIFWPWSIAPSTKTAPPPLPVRAAQEANWRVPEREERRKNLFYYVLRARSAGAHLERILGLCSLKGKRGGDGGG